YEAVACSPMGNELVLELVKRAIDAEQLGQRGTQDFLSVSFSSNDLVGHAFGPDSQEVLDVTLRSDVILRELMDHLDEKVCKDNWVMVVTADHGVCPLPELARAKGKEARRFPIKPLIERAEEMLDELFGPKKGGTKAAGRWIEYSGSNTFYLNLRRIKSLGVRQDDVEEALAVWTAEQPG